MSEVLEKIVKKIFVILLVVMCIAGFRSSIITNDAVSEIFDGLMEQLPFAKIISDVICKLMRYEITIPLFNSSSIITDVIRLTFMAFLYQVLRKPIEWFSYVLFPIKRFKDETDEEYRSRPAYKIRGMLCEILAAPLIAVLASELSKYIFSVAVIWFGEIIAKILGVLLSSSFFMVSLYAILKSGHSFVFAIVWRLIDILIDNMAKVMLVDICCITLYIGIIHGADGLIASSIISLIIFLIVVDIGMGFMRESLVGIDGDYWIRHKRH